MWWDPIVRASISQLRNPLNGLNVDGNSNRLKWCKLTLAIYNVATVIDRTTKHSTEASDR